jgi:thiol-disulfide isomerase/thioredoxin
MQYFKKQWEVFKKKSWFGKTSDILFILLLIALLIPASRREIRTFMSGLLASSPSVIAGDKQAALTPADYQWGFTDMDGQEFKLADFQGKPVFLNFWATWCPPCIAEMPDIQDLYDKFGQQAVFILVSDESPEVVQAFMSRKGFNMPVYRHRYAVPEVFASPTIPVTFILSADGRVVVRKTGAAKWNSSSMISLMNELIGQ